MSRRPRSKMHASKGSYLRMRWGASVVTVIVAVVLLAPSNVSAAVRNFGSWSCSAPRLPSVESVAASARIASPNEITHAITRGDGNFRSRTWTQPDAATFKYRLFSVSTSSARGGWVSAASIESAARTCIL